MEQIGFSVVDASGNEINHWGDAPGGVVNPGRVIWPNGDITEGVTGPINHGDWRLVERRYDWAELASGPTFDGTAVVVTGALASLKAKLMSEIASDAEACRLKFITPGSGKAMSYMEKHNQAEAVNELGEAAANALTEAQRKAQFPTLSASVGIEADTLWACAQLVRQKYEFWATISYGIELAELAGKKAISLASDAATARAVRGAITWPTP